MPLRQVEELKPEDDPRVIASWVSAQAQDLAIIGHEPHLGILGGLLSYGKEGPSLLFRKACGYVFERAAGETGHFRIVDKVGPDLP